MIWHVTALKAGVRMNVATTATESEAREIAKAQSYVLGQREWVVAVTEVRDGGQRTRLVAYRRGKETSDWDGRRRV